MYPWPLDMSTARLHTSVGHEKLMTGRLHRTAQFQSLKTEKSALKGVPRRII